MNPEEDRQSLFPRDWTPSIFRRIKWKLEAVRTFVTNIPSNIKMIAEWVPVLWNNWDWDYNFLLDILKYKLQRMSKHIGEHKHVGAWEEICSEIDECVEIIDRIRENSYTDKEEKALEEKYGEHRFDSVATKREGIRRLDMYYKGAREDGREEEADAAHLDVIHMGRAQLQADYHRLFALIEAKVQGWWD